jgi:hypothetical protein
MKWTLAVLLAAVAACGGGNSETPQQRLIGQWLYTNSAGSAGMDIAFNTNTTYSAQILQLTSTTSANDELEDGVFSTTDTEITFTPQKYTCPGPDPAYSVTYNFNGDSLVLSLSTGATAFSRNTNPASTNFTATFGCFQSNGSFVASPLAAVSN